MSLVGPRPPLPREVAMYEPDALRRLRVRPGLTGLWQVSGRSDLSWEESLRLDLWYVDNWSLVLDLQILLRTARAVFAAPEPTDGGGRAGTAFQVRRPTVSSSGHCPSAGTTPETL